MRVPVRGSETRSPSMLDSASFKRFGCLHYSFRPALCTLFPLLHLPPHIAKLDYRVTGLRDFVTNFDGEVKLRFEVILSSCDARGLCESRTTALEPGPPRQAVPGKCQA